MTEIPGAPLSRHDLDVFQGQINDARIRGIEPTEFIVSSHRIADARSLRVFGIPVRVSDNLALNEGLLIAEGREPITFGFEPTG